MAGGSNDVNNFYEEEMVQKNIALVHSIIRRFSGRAEYDDLLQIGSVGLLNAVRRFDASLGYSFSTYATSLIVGEIKRFLRDDGMIKVSRKLKENSFKVRAAAAEFSNLNGREATISELEKLCGISCEDVTTALEASFEIKSIDEEIYEGKTLGDFAGGKADEGERVIDKIIIKNFLGTLTSRDRKILVYRYFKDRTQRETADLLGISQVQVSRIEKRLLEKLKKLF